MTFKIISMISMSVIRFTTGNIRQFIKCAQKDAAKISTMHNLLFGETPSSLVF